ncbi:MAG: hypothetical protein IPP91_09825 [Betaproteobacteria bacterium]|nr:hypothetical protein [Betaproteobacteria bacterium]
MTTFRGALSGPRRASTRSNWQITFEIALVDKRTFETVSPLERSMVFLSSEIMPDHLQNGDSGGSVTNAAVIPAAGPVR